MVFLYDKMVKEYYLNLPPILKKDSSIINDRGTFFYEEFINGDKQFIFANSQLGIGINLPEIKNTIHCYLPNSITQYIQEIGRSMRDKKKSKSIVLFRPINSSSDYEQAFKHSPHDIVTDFLNGNDSYFIKALRDIVGDDIESIDDSVAITNRFVKYGMEENAAFGYLDKVKPFHLNVLMQLGFINKWYYKDEHLVIEKNNNDYDYNCRLFVKYLKNLGYYNELMEHKMLKVYSSFGLIKLYYEWWFYEYLVYLYEQLIDSYKLFSSHLSKSDIINKLNSYLSISVLDIHELIANDELSIENLFTYSPKDFNKLIPIINQATLFRYEPKYDLYLFVDSIYNSKIDYNYLDRFLANARENDKGSFLIVSNEIYNAIKSSDDKLIYINKLTNVLGFDLVINNVINRISKKDDVYTLLFLAMLNSI